MSLFNIRSKILFKNIAKGLFWLMAIIVGYYYVQKYTHFDLFLEHIGQWPYLVYGVFTASEVIFGIIPPELFMIWSVKHGIFETYVANVALLSVISFLAGLLGYYIGSNLRQAPYFKPIFDKNIRKYKNILNKYAGFLIIIGAITPVPFSAICMLVGATNFPFKNFLLYASSRFLRFAAYSVAIYYF
jgi:membrane protein YqaA with SNARE-associated domain